MVRAERRRSAFLGGLGACAVLGGAVDARAATTCSSLGGTVLYGAGGSSQQPFLTTLGTRLANLASPVHLVYSDSGSACAGYSDLVTPTNITGTALYWDGTGATLSCTLDAGGDPVTFAVMGNAANLCSGITPQPGHTYGTFLGPVQSVDFVVPAQSTQQSISTAAAYYVWGFDAVDAAHTVSPWNVPANIFTRSASSYANLFVALDTGVPAATVATKGTPESTNGATLTALNALNATSPETGIGFLSGEVADGNRSQVKTLAYQHTGQSCGYTPDSDSTSAFDKVNVRNGQYWLWSPIHIFAEVSSTKAILDSATASLVGWVTGAVSPPAGLDVFAAELGAYTIPQCAMNVWRDADLGPLYSYADPASCACKFDFATNTASALRPASCATCTQDSDCAVTHHCRRVGPPVTGDGGGPNVGYCEVN